MSAYTWKTASRIKADPAKAGEQFEQLEKTVGLSAESVLNANRDKDAPLHNEFEWNNKKAAEQYRLEQARYLIRCLCVVEERGEEQEPIEVRAFFQLTNEHNYESLSVIAQDENKHAALLQQALCELRAFMKKYNTLKELYPLKEVIEKIAG